jgi:osmotically inducible protein OsmC
VVSGRICLANGSISFVRTRRIPMVSPLAAAISEVGLDAADHPLDCEHYPHLRHVALAHPWASVGVASWLGNAAGVRMHRDDRCNHSVAPNHSTGRATVLNRLAALGWIRNQSAANIPLRILKALPVITTSIVEFTKEDPHAMTNTMAMTQIETILYTAKGHTTGGRDGGTSRTSDGRLDVKLSVPGTPGTGTNPEQLFAVGWSACFLSAIKIVAARMKVEPAIAQQRADGAHLERPYAKATHGNINVVTTVNTDPVA